MSRPDGFATMDVSSAILDDPKFRALGRRYPELFPAGVTAYLGLLSRSWSTGERVTIDDGWPAFLPDDPAVIDALRAVGLIDADGRLPESAWRSWIGAAMERKEARREAVRRHDAKRNQSRIRLRRHRTDIGPLSESIGPQDGTGEDGSGRGRVRSGRGTPTGELSPEEEGPVWDSVGEQEQARKQQANASNRGPI